MCTYFLKNVCNIKKGNPWKIVKYEVKKTTITTKTVSDTKIIAMEYINIYKDS